MTTLVTAGLLVDLMALLCLVVGVRALLKLGWANRFHHLWFAFAALTVTPASQWEVIVRMVFVLIAFDDAYQHATQWEEWVHMPAHVPLVPPAPDEGTGWPRIYRSPLHLAYSWVASKL